jgi:hypothetical protein
LGSCWMIAVGVCMPLMHGFLFGFGKNILMYNETTLG